MGPKAFCFYIPAAIGYLLSRDADGDSCAANSFCALIEYRLECDPGVVAVVGPAIRTAIIGILENFERFGCERAIYGDVASRYAALLHRLDALMAH